ncbi:MAG TPA: tetratricopeptide repeat protein [Bryobacteraceae bacterium]|nr:tetratricopeptide repeat protein [Bryobacteraceae bacterium]
MKAAEGSTEVDRVAALKQLFEENQWQQVVIEARALPVSEAEVDYYQGVSLAQLGRWDEARSVLLAGQNLKPGDERFPVELGGLAFKQRQYAEAARWLQRALRLNPSDTYAIDFLATIYFLQGNLEAALKYWNRIGKPQIENVRVEPGLHTDPVLLDRAFTFAPAATLWLSDLLTTRARVTQLGVFPTSTVGLDALEDGRFDATFAAQERNGLGTNKMEALLSTFRGVGFQTIYPEYFNLAGSAINVTSMVRWDAQKRRLVSSLSGPLAHNPSHRYWLGVDLRDEDWDLRSSFQGPAPTLGRFKLLRNAVGGGVSSLPKSGWNWSASGELSRRDYADVSGPALPQNVLLKGYQLKQAVQLDRELWRVPERRFESNATMSSETATVWMMQAHTFERLQSSLLAHWFPQMTGDDYAIQEHIRAGKIFGRAPFDEFFMLGLERDNDLWMRAHIGTRDGRKGSAPLGGQYFLSNWEMDKNLYENGLFSAKLSPFLDVGRMDASLVPDFEKWLCDTGVQAKLRVLGIGFAFVYGKDLRSGNNAFYVTASR